MGTKNIPDRMYTIKEVAEILGVCVRQAQRLAQEGPYPQSRWGGCTACRASASQSSWARRR